jgi:hypothetical protein
VLFTIEMLVLSGFRYAQEVHTHLAADRIFIDEGQGVVAVGGRLLPLTGVLGVVAPTRLVGILVGVASSLLASDNDEPWRDAGLLVGRDVLGVRLDRTGIEVLVVSSVLEGVRRPMLTESD